MKANQKRELTRLSLEEGKFTTAYFQSTDIRDIVGASNGDTGKQDQDTGTVEVQEV